MKYRDRMSDKGFVISGTSPDGTLAELVELRDHPYFVGCQYHPEFQSKPTKPHPLFKGFIQACLAYQSQGDASLQSGGRRGGTDAPSGEPADQKQSAPETRSTLQPLAAAGR
jgi:hypothetical protein